MKACLILLSANIAVATNVSNSIVLSCSLLQGMDNQLTSLSEMKNTNEGEMVEISWKIINRLNKLK